MLTVMVTVTRKTASVKSRRANTRSTIVHDTDDRVSYRLSCFNNKTRKWNNFPHRYTYTHTTSLQPTWRHRHQPLHFRLPVHLIRSTEKPSLPRILLILEGGGSATSSGAKKSVKVQRHMCSCLDTTGCFDDTFSHPVFVKCLDVFYSHMNRI